MFFQIIFLIAFKGLPQQQQGFPFIVFKVWDEQLVSKGRTTVPIIQCGLSMPQCLQEA